MQNRDVVVIGGSAGALKVLQRLMGDLPRDLRATVFVVIHSAAQTHSALGRVLDRAGPLPVDVARDGLAFDPGRVYVAPPDLHLLLDDGHMRLRRGPRENLARPAIDPLFRSAAVAYGARAIGVLLSGMLYDGASGLGAIKRCGGIAVVQDPGDALYPDMPRHALQRAEIDYCPRAAELARLLATLVAEPAGHSPDVPEDVRLEARIAAHDGSRRQSQEQPEQPVALSCPECGGAVREIRTASCCAIAVTSATPTMRTCCSAHRQKPSSARCGARCGRSRNVPPCCGACRPRRASATRLRVIGRSWRPNTKRRRKLCAGSCSMLAGRTPSPEIGVGQRTPEQRAAAQGCP